MHGGAAARNSGFVKKLRFCRNTLCFGPNVGCRPELKQVGTESQPTRTSAPLASCP